jgi:hypothetical protein
VAHLLDQQQVELTPPVLAQQLRAQAAADLQAHCRVVQAKAREHGHQALGGEIFRYPEAQDFFAALVDQHIAGLFMQRQDAPGVGQQPLALHRGHHPALVTVQQLAAQALFQAPHLLAHSGLGEVQALGGAGEVLAVGDRDKTA